MKEAFEKIVEKLSSVGGCDDCCEYNKGIDSAIDTAISIVQDVAEEYNNGWIACSDRLPDKAGYEVLATLENSFGQRRVTIIFTGYGDESFWHCNNKEYDLEAWKVIAWQPLPELYKEND